MPNSLHLTGVDIYTFVIVVQQGMEYHSSASLKIFKNPISLMAFIDHIPYMATNFFVQNFYNFHNYMMTIKIMFTKIFIHLVMNMVIGTI